MATPITIVFGTETGNAEDCAAELHDALNKQGYASDLLDADDFELDDLEGPRLLVIITSTFGNGDPPSNAMFLLEHLSNPDHGPYPDLSFAVCGLGDESYPRFCQAGKDFDAHLAARGAQRVVERVDCDVDFEIPFRGWRKQLLSYLDSHATKYGRTEPQVSEKKSGFFGSLGKKFGAMFGGKPPEAPAPAPEPAAPAVQPGTDRHHPFRARYLGGRLLNGEGSNKETRHHIISLEGSGLSYQVGDCFGVYPTNCPEAVDEVLKAAGLKGTESVQTEKGAQSLSEALASRCLQTITLDLYEASVPAAERLEREALRAYLREHHVVDVVRPGRLSAERLFELTRPIHARLYSIASSQKATPTEVHFTIETVRYEMHDRARKGVASTFLAERASDGVDIYLHKNDQFRLPSDDTPIIMVGPGTGIAPFRAFLLERRARGASAENWLFFGHQHQACDFLYGDELRELQDSGVLTRMDLAWSRDTDTKVYVQDRIRERGADVYEWLQKGAHLYVCGDASRMAGDVRSALVSVYREHGGLDADAAAAAVSKLESVGRYQQDVY